MRQILISQLLIAISFLAAAQESKSFFLEEFSISVNKVILEGELNEGKFGFGVGAYHRFLKPHKLNLLTGFEYNRTNQFISSLYEGHSSSIKDVTYTTNCISIPLGLRFNMGHKTIVFIGGGGYADFMVYAKRKGSKYLYSYDEDGMLITTVQEFDEAVDLNSTFGLYLEAGVQIPVSKLKLIIKTDSKLGLQALYSSQESIYNSYFRFSLGMVL